MFEGKNSQGLILGDSTKEMASLTQQLKSFSSLNLEAKSNSSQGLQEIQDFEGWIFVSKPAAATKFKDDLRELRSRNPEAKLVGVIPDSEVNLESVRAFIQSGFDQTVSQSISADTLKSKLNWAESHRQCLLKENVATPSNPNFEVQVDILSPQCQRATLFGWMNETSQLPTLQTTHPETVLFVECQQLRGINSIGIRMWLAWMEKIKASGFVRVEFENLHPGFLQLASFVKNFLPENGMIDSFYLYYWSDKNNLRKEVRFLRDDDFNSTEMKIKKFIEFNEHGLKNSYELDDATPLILKFYPGQIRYL